VSGRLIDDFTSASTNSTAAQQSGQTLGQAFVGLLKSRVVEALEEQIERYVETGNLSADQPDATKSVTADLKEITERLGSFDWATIDGNVATTTISLVPKSKNEKAVMLHLKLRRTEDGFWQLMEISLPQEILDQMQKRSR
jgi:hypothetical protein